MLLLANISISLVMAIGTVGIGLIASPWLKGFLDQFIRLIVGAAIFSFGVAVIVGIGTHIRGRHRCGAWWHVHSGRGG